MIFNIGYRVIADTPIENYIRKRNWKKEGLKPIQDDLSFWHRLLFIALTHATTHTRIHSHSLSHTHSRIQGLFFTCTAINESLVVEPVGWVRIQARHRQRNPKFFVWRVSGHFWVSDGPQLHFTIGEISVISDESKFRFCCLRQISSSTDLFQDHLSWFARGWVASKEGFLIHKERVFRDKMSHSKISCYTWSPVELFTQEKKTEKNLTQLLFSLQIRATLSRWQLEQDTPASTTGFRQFDAVEKNSAKKWIFELGRISLDGATNGRRRLRTFVGQTNCCLDSFFTNF